MRRPRHLTQLMIFYHEDREKRVDFINFVDVELTQIQIMCVPGWVNVPVLKRWLPFSSIEGQPHFPRYFAICSQSSFMT